MSERSERDAAPLLRSDRNGRSNAWILRIWLQKATSTTKLTHSNRLFRSFRSSRRSPDFKRTSLSLIVEDIKKSMSEECDFTLEAKSTVSRAERGERSEASHGKSQRKLTHFFRSAQNAFGDFLEKNKLTDRVYAPKVYEQLTTTKVMTMEYLKGTSLLDASSESGEEQIITALNAWTLMVLELPFFHADVHAGNLIAMTDGRVGFIDFGIGERAKRASLVTEECKSTHPLLLSLSCFARRSWSNRR